MKALKRFSGTKSQRDKKQTISGATEFFKYASAMVLHDKFGFGKQRLNLYYKDLADLFEDFTERYDSFYLLDAMKKQCADRGIVFED